ncbi:hypothetical protein CRYUN_Cryun36dG0063400 [Craigia yunnanensis]
MFEILLSSSDVVDEDCSADHQNMLPLLDSGYELSSDDFLKFIKLEGIAHSPEDAIMPRDIFLLQGGYIRTSFNEEVLTILEGVRTNLKLPWRPLISIDGSTFYELDGKFTIVRHAQSWNVSALEAIRQIFTPSFGRLYY